MRADEACHRDLNHHFADIPFYHDVEAHVVTIENEAGDTEQKLSFNKEDAAQISDGQENEQRKAEDDEKNTKV